MFLMLLGCLVVVGWGARWQREKKNIVVTDYNKIVLSI
jgi:hypothetical protein